MIECDRAILKAFIVIGTPFRVADASTLAVTLSNCVRYIAQYVDLHVCILFPEIRPLWPLTVCKGFFAGKLCQFDDAPKFRMDTIVYILYWRIMERCLVWLTLLPITPPTQCNRFFFRSGVLQLSRLLQLRSPEVEVALIPVYCNISNSHA